MSNNEALSLREPYFDAVSIEEAQGFCIDDRYSSHDLYLKVPGGVAFFANVLAIARRLREPNFESNIVSDTDRLTRELLDHGINFGVHSDDAHELGQAVDPGSVNEDLGCAYIGKRRAVMKLISQTGVTILDQINGIMPEAIDGDKLNDTASKIFDLNWTLASDTSYFNSGPRQIASTIVKDGAPSMVNEGKHDPSSIAIINLRPNTTLDTAMAYKDGYPAYDFDMWAFREVVGRIPSFKDFDPRVLDLVALIDALGTVELLGVKQIYVRK